MNLGHPKRNNCTISRKGLKDVLCPIGAFDFHPAGPPQHVFHVLPLRAIVLLGFSPATVRDPFHWLIGIKDSR